jgi:hypothetical protein
MVGKKEGRLSFQVSRCGAASSIDIAAYRSFGWGDGRDRRRAEGQLGRHLIRRWPVGRTGGAEEERGGRGEHEQERQRRARVVEVSVRLKTCPPFVS